MQHKHVLIVEDEAPIRDMIRFALERSDFTVSEAEDAQEARLAIAERRPDLVLLDWMLPGVSGAEFARELRRDELTADLAIIMVTARVDADDRVRGLNLGADDYVTKPFSSSELVARVRAVLRRSLPGGEDETLELDGLTLDAASQRVAIERLEALNRQIVARMRTGVMVFNNEHRILQSNPSADGFFATPMVGQHLPAALVERHQHWRQAPHMAQSPLRVSRQSPQVSARFADLDTGHEDLTLVFLEDTARVAQEAQQMNLASLGRLSATLAHEIRNPLSAISHATELLDEDMEKPEDSHLLGIIRNHVKRVNGIISDVLDLSRRPRSQAARFDVAPVLEEVTASWHQRGIPRERLRLQHRDEGLEVRFDRSQLIQVVDNLIGNAFDHGGADCRVTVAYGRHPQTRLPWISVADNGDGIPGDAAAHLFEPFYTTKPVGQGTGLGLFVVDRLVQALGGEVAAANTKQGGAVLTVEETRMGDDAVGPSLAQIALARTYLALLTRP